MEIYPGPGDAHPLHVQNGGVVVFFVLSGFLNYYTVFPKRSREVGRPLANAVDTTARYAIMVGLMALAFWLGLRSV